MREAQTQQPQGFGVGGDQCAKSIAFEVGKTIQFSRHQVTGLEQVIVTVRIGQRRRRRCLAHRDDDDRQYEQNEAARYCEQDGADFTGHR